MSDGKISAITPGDWPAHHHFCLVQPERFALVERFYRGQGYKIKCAHSELVFAITAQANEVEAGEFIAAVRLLPQPSGNYWLRNLLVAKDWRGQGIASQLMHFTLASIKAQGCYCFALRHLQDFYLKLGLDLQPAHCPADIQQKYDQYRARGRDWLLMGRAAGQ